MKKRLIYSSLIFSIFAYFAVASPSKLRYALLHLAVPLREPFIYYNLGDCYAKGRGTKRDLNKAELWYQKAASHNYAKAMYKLGNLHSHRHGIQKDLENMVIFWQKIPVDLPQAIKWYTSAAELGNASACIRLGYFNLDGIGMPVDYKQSLQWYRKAARAGHKSGMVRLGYFYSHGLDREPEWQHVPCCWEGIQKGYPKALKWYLRAASAGEKNAQYMVGFMLSHGAINASSGAKNIDNIDLEIPGIPLDYKKAVKWYTKAAGQGHSAAHLKLGYFYLRPNLAAEKDPQKAFEWWRQGAEAGYCSSMRRIGMCYADGVGVPRDDVKALEWYMRAAHEGDECAEDDLEEYAQNAAVYFTRAVVGDIQENSSLTEIAKNIRADLYKIFKAQGIVFPYPNPTTF